MMKRLRAALPVVVAAVATWALTTATTAQTAIPPYAFTRDSAGQVWMIGKAVRVAIPMYPATDDQIAASPWTGLWMVPKEDGTGIDPVSVKPEWAAEVPQAVAAAQPAPPSATAATATATPVPAPPAATTEEPVKLSGERAQNTKPFALKGGNYTAKWEAKLLGSASSCVAYASLYRVDPKRSIEQVMSGVNLNRESNRSESGETQIYGVTAGQYYLDVNTSACSWSVTISPQ